MKNKIAIGVDVGGSHVSCAAFDLTDKKYLGNTLSENDLDNHANADVVIASWGEVIKQTLEKLDADQVVGIGFSMPGPFDYENGIPRFTGENGKYENIYGIDVPAKLRAFLNLSENFKIRFINDATAFALGEDSIGKAKDVSGSLSITLGTGFGSAFIKNGLPVVEGTEVPKQGCLWHQAFEDGIADDYFSTRGFLNRYKEKTGKELSGVKELSDLVGKEPIAKELFDDFGEKLGELLRAWIVSFGIETLVIGGNISRAFHHFEESLFRFLKEEKLHMNVEISELKETAAFVGSATLLDDDFYMKLKPLLRLM